LLRVYDSKFNLAGERPFIYFFQEFGRGLIRIEQPEEGTFGEGGSTKSGSDEERPKFATRDRT
jgi:hypothetical protein